MAVVSELARKKVQTDSVNGCVRHRQEQDQTADVDGRHDARVNWFHASWLLRHEDWRRSEE